METLEKKVENSVIESAINELAKDTDILALVKSIESGVKTTKGNYGRYMQVLGQWGNGSKTMLYVVSQALKRAGADSYGVDWAVKLLNG